MVNWAQNTNYLTDYQLFFTLQTTFNIKSASSIAVDVMKFLLVYYVFLSKHVEKEKRKRKPQTLQCCVRAFINCFLRRPSEKVKLKLCIMMEK